jgi:S1-C subfamily serine protease
MTSMALDIALALVLASGPAGPSYLEQVAPGNEAESQAMSGMVTPVFAERTCRVTRPRNISRGRLSAIDEEVKSVAFGSAFAIRSGERVLLVTAAHVVRLPAQITSITSGSGTQYDTSDGETKIERGPVLRAIGIDPLKTGTTARDAEVKIWGFPAIARTDRNGKPLPAAPSASQTSQRTDVTDVRATEVICAPLNGVETRGGFSGGPIVDRSGRAVGMIMRSTPETTRCRSIAAIEELARSFEVRSSPAS